MARFTSTNWQSCLFWFFHNKIVKTINGERYRSIIKIFFNLKSLNFFLSLWLKKVNHNERNPANLSDVLFHTSYHEIFFGAKKLSGYVTHNPLMLISKKCFWLVFSFIYLTEFKRLPSYEVSKPLHLNSKTVGNSEN